MENWRDSLPDDLKVNPTLAKYEQPEEAFKALIEANGRLGRSITVPNDDSDPEEMQAYYEKLQRTTQGKLIPHPDTADSEQANEFWKLLGKPEDVKGYEAPEGVKLQPDVIDNVRKMALEAGLTKKQFQAQISLLDAEYEAQNQNLTEMQEADKAIVKKKFGLAEERKKAAINTLIAQYSDPDHPLGELNAAAYLMLDKIVDAFSGKGPQVFNQPTHSSAKTPDEIESELNRTTTKLMKGRAEGMDGYEYNRLMKKREALLKEREASH